MPDAATLENALCDAQGALVDVTKIEIEILEGGRFRWILWQDSRRLYSSTGHVADLPAMLESSRVICRAMAGLPPADVTVN